MSKKLKKHVGSFVVEVDDNQASIAAKSGIWKVAYSNTSLPYYRLSDALQNKNENLETFCQAMFVLDMMAASDDKITESFLNAYVAYCENKVTSKPVSDAEDEVILRETQVMLQQDEEAVNKHIEATNNLTK